MKNELLHLANAVDELYAQISKADAVPEIDLPQMDEFLSKHFSFAQPHSVAEITENVSTMLSTWSTQTNHPRHFGLYQPSLRNIGVIADALVAAYNPQVGAWWFSPAANEIEKHALTFISKKFGFKPKDIFSSFTSGGSESTTTAVLCALTQFFPHYAQDGLVGFTGRPKIYVSTEAHDSIVKIAHQLGLGRGAISRIPTDSKQRLNLDLLTKQVAQDRDLKAKPFLVIATAGTTAGGAIDPLPELSRFCQSENLWLHVDAAWGGGFVFSNKTKKYLKGLGDADSITWDPHKSLPIPLGAGYFLCKHKESVKKTFNVSASYIPDEVEGQLDLYKMGLPWSRRFIGLKVFMVLAELGKDGLAQMIEHQFSMGKYLLQSLKATGWTVENSSPLPIVCFSHPSSKYSTEEILNKVMQRKKCWLSKVSLNGERSALRACITSYKTREADIDILIDELTIASS
ncbi:aminotransferase class V-fold PLP-dependent enzyme [Deltaproteobacteria bacterium TL4]